LASPHASFKASITLTAPSSSLPITMPADRWSVASADAVIAGSSFAGEAKRQRWRVNDTDVPQRRVEHTFEA
jgi:hypothetical protein